MIPLNPKLFLYAAVATLGFVGAGWIRSLPEKYRDEGRKEIHAQYAESARIAKIDRNAEIERVKHEQTEINRKVVADYENKLKSLSDRLADAKRIGLRVPKTICSGIASTAEATSTEGNNEAAEFRLPEWLTNNFYEYAARAEEIKLQLGSCQNWIIQNGFYSVGQNPTPNK